MYNIDDFMRINVINTNPTALRGEFTDLSLVEKYEMPEDSYEKLGNSVRAFKKRNKMGRFADVDQAEVDRLAEEFSEEASKIKLEDRCEVEISEGGMKKRGKVAFVGKTDFKPGFWVGIHYDEPVGKHNGRLGIIFN